MLMVNKRQREVEHVIDTVHSKEVPGVHFCCWTTLIINKFLTIFCTVTCNRHQCNLFTFLRVQPLIFIYTHELQTSTSVPYLQSF